MFQADLAHGGQFFLRPDSAHRIVGVAQDEKLYFVFYDLCFKIFNIHGITAVFKCQRIVDQVSAIVQNGFGKRIIDGPLDQHAVTRIGKSPDRSADRVNDSGSFNKP